MEDGWQPSIIPPSLHLISKEETKEKHSEFTQAGKIKTISLMVFVVIFQSEALNFSWGVAALSDTLFHWFWCQLWFCYWFCFHVKFQELNDVVDWGAFALFGQGWPPKLVAHKGEEPKVVLILLI